MTSQVPTPLVLADDLSGAAETAAALGAHLRPELVLWPHLPVRDTHRPLVVDLDSRHLAPADAAARTGSALGSLPHLAPLFTKIDSLLRGNIGAHVAALTGPGALVVLTPALPHQGRTVVDGVLHDNGVPLDRTLLWALEPTAPPARVSAVLPGLPVTEIGLRVVRGVDLPRALGDASGRVAVCDAEDEQDLAAIVDAGLRAHAGVRFVGSSALARALSPHLARPGGGGLPVAARAPSGGVLYVLGTGSGAARAQADLLHRRIGAARYVLPPEMLAGMTDDAAGRLGADLGAHLGERSVVVQVAAATAPAVRGSDIVAGLARLVGRSVAAAPGWPVRLVLSGGETARGVLDALDCHRLEVIEEIHPGAVLMTTGPGWLVVTRPGSHGGSDSLWSIHRALYDNPNRPGDDHGQ